jgi:hypothetical protein
VFTAKVRHISSQCRKKWLINTAALREIKTIKNDGALADKVPCIAVNHAVP